MDNKLEIRRILIFIAIAFGLSWAWALVIYLNGGLMVPAAIPMLTFGYMMMPALAHVITRLITRQGWANTGLRPNFRRGWPYWLVAWVLPAVLVIIGAAAYYLVFPQQFDSSLTQLQAMLPQTGIDPWTVMIMQVAQAILIAPLVNGLFTFGEEFGWRGYLLPQLMPLGGRKAMLFSGVIWGAWHWPLTLMGHNYGLDYPGYPWAGMLMMLWFSFVLGVFLSWVTLRGGSIWPAVIGHAAVNGIGTLPAVMTQGEPNMLLGPMIAGLVGSIGFAVVTLALFLSPRALEAGRSPMVNQTLPIEQEEVPIL